MSTCVVLRPPAREAGDELTARMRASRKLRRPRISMPETADARTRPAGIRRRMCG